VKYLKNFNVKISMKYEIFTNTSLPIDQSSINQSHRRIKGSKAFNEML